LENNTRVLALKAIIWVVLEKKSLSAFAYPQEVSALTKSLVFGTLRFYHQLNDVVSRLLKHSLEKQDLDIHCLMLLGAYQILYSNIAQHASIYETVNIADGLDKPWAKKLVNALSKS
jgi:16S rRNA (cytosine967-C5)-methyltransferase